MAFFVCACSWGALDTILKKTKGEKILFEHLVYVGDFLANRYDRDKNECDQYSYTATFTFEVK